MLARKRRHFDRKRIENTLRIEMAALTPSSKQLAAPQQMADEKFGLAATPDLADQCLRMTAGDAMVVRHSQPATVGAGPA